MNIYIINKMFLTADIVLSIADLLSYSDIHELSTVNRFLRDTIKKNSHIFKKEAPILMNKFYINEAVKMFPNLKLYVIDIINTAYTNVYKLDLNYMLNTVNDEYINSKIDDIVLYNNLNIIDLSNTGISRLEWAINIPSLRTLILNGCKNINEIPVFNNISKIELNNTDITNIDNLYNIDEIFVANTNISNISKLSNVRLLDISRTNVEIIPFLPKLKILITDGNSIDRYDNISNIEHISIRGTIVTITKIYKDLITANFSGCSFLDDVSEMKNLKELNLSYTSVKYVSSLHNVQKLNLYNCRKIDDESFISEGEPVIMNTSQIILSKTNIRNVISFKNTKHLDLSYTYISCIKDLMFGIFDILDFSSCNVLHDISCLIDTRIKKLYINDCTLDGIILNNTDSLFMKHTQFINIKLSNIIEADFSCTNINDNDMKNIFLDKTKKIRLVGTKISDVSILKHLEYVDISYCKKIKNYEFLMNIPYLDISYSNIKNKYNFKNRRLIK